MPRKTAKGAAGGGKGQTYRLGAPRGDQKFELPNKLKETRGGGNEWRQTSRLQIARDMTAASVEDYTDKAFEPGPSGKASMKEMLESLHVANKAMEDVRQPLDNPYLGEDKAKLRHEVAQYRRIASDRAARAEEIERRKARIHLHLRLLSGERVSGYTTRVASNYEELMQGFVDVFPWHIGEVVVEYADGRAVHPQTACFRPGDEVYFRELAPPTEDLVTEHLAALPAGWVRQTYRPGLLALSTSLIAGERNPKRKNP